MYRVEFGVSVAEDRMQLDIKSIPKIVFPYTDYMNGGRQVGAELLFKDNCEESLKKMLLQVFDEMINSIHIADRTYNYLKIAMLKFNSMVKNVISMIEFKEQDMILELRETCSIYLYIRVSMVRYDSTKHLEYGNDCVIMPYSTAKRLNTSINLKYHVQNLLLMTKF